MYICRRITPFFFRIESGVAPQGAMKREFRKTGSCPATVDGIHRPATDPRYTVPRVGKARRMFRAMSQETCQIKLHQCLRGKAGRVHPDFLA
jgi:hypothetical protein